MAAVPFDGGQVPVELAQEFAGGGSFYRSFPDRFPLPSSFPAAVDMQLAGSFDQTGLQRVLLLSTRSVTVVREALLAAYAADGWMDINPSSVWVSGSARISGVLSLCHTTKGMLSFTLATAAQGTKVTAILSPVRATASAPQTVDCAAQKAINDAQSSIGSSLYAKLLPAFELPVGAVSKPANLLGASVIGVQGTTTANGTMTLYTETSNSFELTGQTMTQVFQHYAQQLQKAGWQADSDSVGTRSAVAVWFKTQDIPASTGSGTQKVDSVGMLQLLQVGQSGYSMVFRVQAAVQVGAIAADSPIGFYSAK